MSAPEQGIVRCAASGALKTIDREAMRVRNVITTGAINRLGQRVVQSGADLSEYHKNPIVLWNHDDSLPAVGRNAALELANDRWVADTEFAPTPLGRELFSLYDGGFMTSWSIGFRPDPRHIEFVKDAGGNVAEVVFHRWKLLEYSAVTIPANADAITLALRNGLICKDTLDLLLASPVAAHAAGPSADAPGVPADVLAPSLAKVDLLRLTLKAGRIHQRLIDGR